jgi:hypothetical protein
MEKKKKDLLIIYLNEFNLEFLIKGSKKYNCHSIKEILKLNKLLTFTKDKKQDKDLDPWVQSVSINTGKSSKKHKIFKLGETLNKNHIQVWDKLSQKNITCSVWGAMNSRLRDNKNLNYYFPDPWNFKDKTKPKNLMGLYHLPNYYAKNYLKFNYFKFFYFSLIFFLTLITKVNLNIFFKDLFFTIKLFFKRGIKNFILFFLFDIIFLNIFEKTIANKKSSFSMIFLNSIAHYQHNNWNELKNEKYFFLFVENIFKKILKCKKHFNSILIFNGFTQKKINEEFLLRPKNPNFFLSKFIKFKKLEQDMTNGGLLFFRNKREKKYAIETLNTLHCFGRKIFYLKKYKGNKLFYKINLKSKKVINKLDLNKNKISLKKYFFENLRTFNHNVNKKEIGYHFIESVKFIKSTGAHNSKGQVIFKNINHLNKISKIENHKIFNFVCKHFEIYG